VHFRFGLTQPDADAIRDWIRQSGIRWGLDEVEQTALDLPGAGRHSFSAGLHKLFLSYALGDAGTAVAGWIAGANPEGQAALALGPFWRFVEALRALRQDFLLPKSAAGWRDALIAAIDGFVAPDPQWAEDLRAVRAAISRLHDDMRGGGLRNPVSARSDQSGARRAPGRSRRRRRADRRGHVFGIGSLADCPIGSSARLGMNDGSFPSGARPVEFDLMAARPVRGDRQRRVDERNLFLDLMLAARERFHISYTGRSIRDNSPQPPSVLVAELLDYLVRACSSSQAQADEVRRRLVVEHPLQAFSHDYFVEPPTRPDGRIRSFNAEYCDALRAAPALVQASSVTPGVGPMASKMKRRGRRRGRLGFFKRRRCPLPSRNGVRCGWTTWSASSAIPAATCCASAWASPCRNARRNSWTTSRSSRTGRAARRWRKGCCRCCCAATLGNGCRDRASGRQLPVRRTGRRRHRRGAARPHGFRGRTAR